MTCILLHPFLCIAVSFQKVTTTTRMVQIQLTYGKYLNSKDGVFSLLLFENGNFQ